MYGIQLLKNCRSSFFNTHLNGEFFNFLQSGPAQVKKSCNRQLNSDWEMLYVVVAQQQKQKQKRQWSTATFSFS